jgi:neutral ceramidase
VRYGVEIKQASKFPFTFPVELANGCVGYVPTGEASSASGGYETGLASHGKLEITAGHQLAKTGIELANQMTPAPVPQPPPVVPSCAPWSYGNVSPELR